MHYASGKTIVVGHGKIDRIGPEYTIDVCCKATGPNVVRPTGGIAKTPLIVCDSSIVCAGCPVKVDRTTRRGDCRGEGESGHRILVQQDHVEYVAGLSVHYDSAKSRSGGAGGTSIVDDSERHVEERRAD